MEETDGGVLLGVNLSVGKAEKELDRLAKKATILQESLDFKKAKFGTVTTDLEKARKQLEKLQSATKIDPQSGKFVVSPENSKQISITKDAVRSLEAEQQKLNSEIQDTSMKLEAVKSRYGEVASSARGLGAIEAARNKVTSILGGTVVGLKNGLMAGAKAAAGLGSKIMAAAKNVKLLGSSTDRLGAKLKRLGSTVKQVFVFGVILKGLQSVRSALSQYLSVDSDLQKSLGRLKGVLLTAFEPIYTAVLPALTALLNSLTSVMSAVARFVASVFGKTAAQAQENAKALQDEADSLNDTEKAAKKAAKPLANFDEINRLSFDDGSGGSSGVSAGDTAASAPTFDLSFDDTQLKSWGEAFGQFLDSILQNGIPALKAGFEDFSNWLNTFSEKLYRMFTLPGITGGLNAAAESILSGLAGIGASVLDKVKAIGSNIAQSLNDLVAKIDWLGLGHALGASLNLALLMLVEFAYTFDWAALGRSLAEMVNGVIAEIDWYAFGKLLWVGFKVAIETLTAFLLGLDMTELAKAASNIVKGFFNSMTETLKSIDWAELGHQVATFLVNVDWAGVAQSVFTAIGSAFGAAASFLWGFIKDAWASVVGWWYEVAFEDGQFTFKGLLEGILSVAKNIFEWLKENVIDPFVNAFKSLGGDVVQGFLDGVIGAWKKVISWVKEAVSNITKLFSGQNYSVSGEVSGSLKSVPSRGTTVARSIPSIAHEQIPKLAQGAVIPPNREFMAVLGDQKRGYNIEAPADLIRQIVREESGGNYTGLLQQILAAIKEGKVMMVDSTVFARLIYQANREESWRVGQSMVNVF